MELTKDQQAFYQQARERCRQDVDQMNNTIRAEWQHLNDEIKRVQELIQTFETRKQTIGQMYASASDMLGVENDLDVSPAISQEGAEESSEDLGVGEIDL
jgi:sensor domain CHASE-containing protein